MKNLFIIASAILSSAVFFASPLQAQTLVWDPAAATNPGGSGSGSVSGNTVTMELTGGTDKNNSYVRLSTSGTYPEWNFTSPESEGIKLSALDLSLTGSANGSHIAYFTITNTPSSLPYGAATALSLEIRQDGAFSLGWRENYSGSGGWPSRSASTILASAAASSVRYTGVELYLMDDAYRLLLYTAADGVLEYTGAFSPATDWGDLGVNLVLQKAQQGTSTWSSLTIGDFQVTSIPEPSTLAVLTSAGLLFAALSYRKRCVLLSV